MRRLLLVVLASSLTLLLPVSAQTPAPGMQDLAVGMRLVNEGDLEAALITLDSVVQHLKQQRGREKDLATAHLYLAMSHLGLSQSERARSEMRERPRCQRRTRACGTEPRSA